MATREMDIARSNAEPCTSIFEVEMIDFEGYAWLFGGLYLHEAIRICADLEREARPGREPRISIPPERLGVGLADE